MTTPTATTPAAPSTITGLIAKVDSRDLYQLLTAALAVLDTSDDDRWARGAVIIDHGHLYVHTQEVALCVYAQRLAGLPDGYYPAVSVRTLVQTLKPLRSARKRITLDVAAQPNVKDGVIGHRMVVSSANGVVYVDAIPPTPTTAETLRGFSTSMPAAVGGSGASMVGVSPRFLRLATSLVKLLADDVVPLRITTGATPTAPVRLSIEHEAFPTFTLLVMPIVVDSSPTLLL